MWRIKGLLYAYIVISGSIILGFQLIKKNNGAQYAQLIALAFEGVPAAMLRGRLSNISATNNEYSFE